MLYLDNNSTTACDPEVLNTMLPHFCEEYANPSSSYAAGRNAKKAIAKAREQIAAAINASGSSVTFTSGATEANNLVVFGLLRKASHRTKLVVSAVEHKSVMVPASVLSSQGIPVQIIPVDRNGVVDLNVARQMIDQTTLLVSVQAANNEVGTLQPVKELAEIAHDAGAIFHCDAAQFLGKLPCDLQQLGIDVLTISSHKIYGPKGVGALVCSRGDIAAVIEPLFYGGQTYPESLRPGTQNVPGIVGFGKACELLGAVLPAEISRISALRVEIEAYLLATVPSAKINGHSAPRLPGTTSIVIPGVPNEMLLANLSTVCVSTGAACSRGVPGISHVLAAMQMSGVEAESTIRISVGRFNTLDEVRAGGEQIAATAKSLLADLSSEVCNPWSKEATF